MGAYQSLHIWCRRFRDILLLSSCPRSLLALVNLSTRIRPPTGECDTRCGLGIAKLQSSVESSDVVGKIVIHANEVYVCPVTGTNFSDNPSKPGLDQALHLYRKVRLHRFFSVAAAQSGGAGIKWLKQLLGVVQYREIDRLVSLTNGSRLPLGYWLCISGQHAKPWNHVATGMLIALHQLTNDTNSRHSGTIRTRRRE